MDADRPIARQATRGFQIAHRVRGGMNHWVVSELNRDEFVAMVRAIERADGAG